MAVVAVTQSIIGPNGQGAGNATVAITLYPSVAATDEHGNALGGEVILRTDGNGAWSALLQRTDQITPAGLCYQVLVQFPGNILPPSVAYGVVTGAGWAPVQPAGVQPSQSVLTVNGQVGNVEIPGVLVSPVAPPPIAAAGLAGSSGQAADGGHTHTGVHSVAGAGGASVSASSGDVTVSVPALSTSAADIAPVAVLPAAGSAGRAADAGHAHAGYAPFVVTAYGARGDARLQLGGARLVSGSKTVQFTGALASDAGKTFVGYGGLANGGPWIDTVASVVPGVSLTLAGAPAGANVTNATIDLYHDDTAGILAAIVAAQNAGGGTVYFPPGLYVVRYPMLLPVDAFGNYTGATLPGGVPVNPGVFNVSGSNIVFAGAAPWASKIVQYSPWGCRNDTPKGSPAAIASASNPCGWQDCIWEAIVPGASTGGSVGGRFWRGFVFYLTGTASGQTGVTFRDLEIDGTHPRDAIGYGTSSSLTGQGLDDSHNAAHVGPGQGATNNVDLVEFDRCHLHGFGDECVYGGGDGGPGSTLPGNSWRVTYRDCLIHDNNGSAISTSGSTHVIHCEVYHCTNCIETIVGHLQHIQIEDSLFYDAANAEVSILDDDQNQLSGGVIIRHNTFEAASGHGLLVLAANRYEIAGNMFIDCGQAAGKAMLFLGTQSAVQPGAQTSALIIEGNQFLCNQANVAVGLWLAGDINAGAGTWLADLVLTNNRFIETRQARAGGFTMATPVRVDPAFARVLWARNAIDTVAYSNLPTAATGETQITSTGGQTLTAITPSTPGQGRDLLLAAMVRNTSQPVTVTVTATYTDAAGNPQTVTLASGALLTAIGKANYQTIVTNVKPGSTVSLTVTSSVATTVYATAAVFDLSLW